jgi:hypothetical protein
MWPAGHALKTPDLEYYSVTSEVNAVGLEDNIYSGYSKYTIGVWIALIWLKTGTCGMMFSKPSGNLGSIKCRGFLD